MLSVRREPPITRAPKILRIVKDYRQQRGCLQRTFLYLTFGHLTRTVLYLTRLHLAGLQHVGAGAQHVGAGA